MKNSLLLNVMIFRLAINVALVSLVYANQSMAVEAEQSQHGIQLAIGQQRQVLSFEDQELGLGLSSQSLQYQYSRSDWLFGMTVNHSAGEKVASGNMAYQLELDSRAISTFAEVNLNDFWLGLVVAQGRDDSQYKITRSNARGNIRDDSHFRNLGLDLGYGHFLTSSYWSVSASLTQQWLTAKKELNLVKIGKAAIIQSSDTKEQALLAGLNSSYEYYFPLTDDYELALSGTANYQFSLSGDGRSQFNNQRRSPAGVQQNQRNEVLTSSGSSATALSVRLSLLHARYSLFAEVDQLVDQPSSDAYYGAGFGISF